MPFGPRPGGQSPSGAAPSSSAGEARQRKACPWGPTLGACLRRMRSTSHRPRSLGRWSGFGGTTQPPPSSSRRSRIFIADLGQPRGEFGIGEGSAGDGDGQHGRPLAELSRLHLASHLGEGGSRRIARRPNGRGPTRPFSEARSGREGDRPRTAGSFPSAGGRIERGRPIPRAEIAQMKAGRGAEMPARAISPDRAYASEQAAPRAPRGT